MEFWKFSVIMMAMGWITGCTWHGIPYSYSAYQAGKAEAAPHLVDKGIAAMTVGAPFGETEAEKLLEAEYGISTVLIPTCMPTNKK
jgi:hypothetical protein